MNCNRSFHFGPFSLFPERQLLLRGNTPVRLGGRALDLLTALVERPGEVVEKASLMARAWPSAVVVEANLKVNIGALRRVLEDDSAASRYIATVTGRGYRFVAPVQQYEQPAYPLADLSQATGSTDLDLIANAITTAIGLANQAAMR
jgi:DNA-binding winged helix-turn-helix (wHTH) protein